MKKSTHELPPCIVFFMLAITLQKPRQNIELVSTPVATLLSNHAAQLDARPSNACNYRPQTPLDIATIQVSTSF